MTIIDAIILGIVEGLTEFLPVSSTAHLIWASKILGVPQSEFVKFFEVFIQSGAIMAIIVLYLKYLIKNKHQIKLLLLSFIPTGIVGLVLHQVIKEIFFETQPLIITVFFLMGIIFIAFEYLVKIGKIKPERQITQMSYAEALLIGLGQSMAVVPGVSRAGAVIITMMAFNFSRSESAVYSFLLAVPTILAAGIFDLFNTNINLAHSNYLQVLIIGFVFSFISALIVVKWFVAFLKKRDLTVFGVYRIIATIILIILSL